MKKFVLLLVCSVLLTSCFPDDFTGNPNTDPYVNTTYTLENTEYCRFDPGQDAHFPYLFRSNISQGYIREFIVTSTDELTIRFNRNGRRARIRGTVSVTDQYVTKIKKFDVDILIRNIEPVTTLVIVSSEFCLRSTDDFKTSTDITGSLTSIDDDEVIDIVPTEYSIVYFGSESAYQNNTHVQGMSLDFSTTLGVRGYGQAVFIEQ